MKKSLTLILTLLSIAAIGCGKNLMNEVTKEVETPKSHLISGGLYYTNPMSDSTGQFLVGFVSDTTLQYVKVQTNLNLGESVKVLQTYTSVVELPGEDGLNHVLLFDETHLVKKGETYYSMYFYNNLSELNILVNHLDQSSMEISL